MTCTHRGQRQGATGEQRTEPPRSSDSAVAQRASARRSTRAAVAQSGLPHVGAPVPPPPGGKPNPNLFAGSPLSEVLTAAGSRAMDRLAEWPPDDLLNAEEEDVAEQLIRQATIQVPSMARDQAWLEPPAEVTIQAHDVRRQFHATVTRFTLVIPVTGEPSLFRMWASHFSPPEIQAAIDHGDRSLRLHCDNPDSGNHAKAYFEQTLDQIEQRLAWTRADIEAHNQQMAKHLPAAVVQRRAKLLRDRELQASIGYPIAKRPDADSYSVPVKRRTITASRPSGHPNAFVPEPAIEDADYEAVLAVLRNARNALERSPSMSAKLGEEEIRDLLLVSLNAQFEGKAAGEVFNCTGRSDILVREGDRNVFIGECKIYDPKDTQGMDALSPAPLTSSSATSLARHQGRSGAVHPRRERLRHPQGTHRYRQSPQLQEARQDQHRGTARLRPACKWGRSREIRLAFLPFLVATKST